jgi:hypothetical protein
MPRKIILQKLIELIFESTTSHLADIAVNKTTVSRVISTFLPPVAGSYVAWCFPARILELNYFVFKRCMQLTNGILALSLELPVRLFVFQELIREIYFSFVKG